MNTTLPPVAGIVASWAAIAGVVFCVGPSRAIALALRTRFRGARDVSQRTAEVHTLRSMLSTVQRDQYVVVIGPKGVG
jgi:hypothetical protein